MRFIELSRSARWLVVAACLAFPLASPAQDLPNRFDPARDAAKDVATAMAAAKAQHKRVIVDVGGEWCSWCHLLDNFIEDNADVKALVEAKYVWVKVNWSPQNKNESLLAKWPKIKGYPHLFVLDGTGKLVHSQETGSLEAEKDYDKAKFVAFLKRYAGK
ncbi:thioredoxin family protein [Ideonella sp.]|uniref:thioredoxin family protein n=1 Tax=Ideonella sp. TaxID=1929293 RepID=UPI002B497A95|nr:thioredoxin family protein [Ideonella sp.]HJV71615.1 thioredoxin family protein [Ideonella sp.]